MRLLLAGLFLAFPTAAFAQTITFESIPGVVGEAPEGSLIGDQFDVAPYFVRFRRLDPNLGLQPATLAKVGAPQTAFVGQVNRGCDGRSSDADKPNVTVPYSAGCFFLTDDGQALQSSPPIQPIVVRYTVPVLQASGVILDIDNQEAFTIHARDANDVDITAPVVLTHLSGSGGNGDASIWFFDVNEPIHSILIDYTGGGSSKGIAFDEFSPASACPSQVVHLGNGLAGAGGLIPAISMGCPQVGRAGSVEIFNGAGAAHGALVVSMSGATQPFRCGTVLSTHRWIFPHSLSGSPGAAGQGRHSVPFGPIASALVGTTFYLQAGYCDPAAPCGELSLTEILRVTVR